MRKHNIAWALSCGLCLAGILLLQALKLGGIYLWIAGLTTAKLTFYLSCALIWLLWSWLTVFLCRRTSKRWLCLVLALVMLPVLGVQWISWRINHSDECAVFLSPDSAHTIVVQEETGFFSHGHTVFQLTSGITMRKIGAFATEPHRPEDLRICWEEDRVEISIHGYDYWCTLLENRSTE